jgi:hypothetical protein
MRIIETIIWNRWSTTLPVIRNKCQWFKGPCSSFAPGPWNLRIGPGHMDVDVERELTASITMPCIPDILARTPMKVVRRFGFCVQGLMRPITSLHFLVAHTSPATWPTSRCNWLILRKKNDWPYILTLHTIIVDSKPSMATADHAIDKCH